MTTETPFDISPTITGETPSDPGSGATYWIRLTGDPPPLPELITRADLARPIDDVMGISNHCIGSKTPDAYQESGEQTAEQYAQEKLAGEGCQDFASALNVSTNCALDKRLGEPLIKNVYVHCSSDTVRDDYTLRSTGSAIIISGPTRSSRILRLEIDFGETSYVPVRYYAEKKDVDELWRDLKYAPTWEGPVLQGITRIAPPKPYWKVSGTVVVGKEVSGKLIIFLPIQFDTYRVSIPGQQIGNKRNYSARFFASSQYLDKPSQIMLEDVTEADPQANDCSLCGGDSTPFPDGTSIENINNFLQGTETSGLSTPQEDDEPVEWPAEIGCCDGEEIEYTPYQESEFTGSSDLPEEVKEQYRRRYGPDTEFIGVGPTNPPCGERVERQTAGPCDSCAAGYIIVDGIINDVIRIDQDGQNLFHSGNGDDKSVKEQYIYARVYFDPRLPVTVTGIDNAQVGRQIEYDLYYDGVIIGGKHGYELSEYPSVSTWYVRTFEAFC